MPSGGPAERDAHQGGPAIEVIPNGIFMDAMVTALGNVGLSVAFSRPPAASMHACAIDGMHEDSMRMSMQHVPLLSFTQEARRCKGTSGRRQ